MRATDVERTRGDDDRELRRRVMDGLAAEVAAFASGGPGSRVIRRGGVVAGITPAARDRSFFNAVHYEDAGALAGTIDWLAETYAGAGIRAWGVWVPDDDRDVAGLLAARGLSLDSSPRAMAMWLDDLPGGRPDPDGVAESEQGGEEGAGQRTAARLNNRAYGYEGDAFEIALSKPTRPPLRWVIATSDDRPVACVGTIDAGEDCVVTGVATLPEHRRRGIAGWLVHRTLERARDRGLRSASLQAAAAGAGIYRRLGFRDLGVVELWERRLPAS